VGVVALSAHGGRGNSVGLIATEESGARLVFSRLTLGREGRAWWAFWLGRVALARVGRSTRVAVGKDKAKMAGGGSDVRMADAAGAAGNSANGAGGPAGRARSEASAGSRSRQDGSSADNWRDLRGADFPAGYPDEAEYQAAELPLVEGAGPSPFRRTYFSPPSLGTRDGILVMSYDVLMDAATNNRRVALVRIEQGNWGVPPGFIDILNGVPDNHVDAVVAEVHGNANYGDQGEARQAYEVLAYANELVRYGRPFHDFHTRLYAWALLFPVHQMGIFEVAANNFGRLRRACPEAVFQSRRPVKELSVPFAQEAGMEEYLDELIEASSATAPTCIWMSFSASHRISSAVHVIGTALDVLQKLYACILSSFSRPDMSLLYCNVLGRERSILRLRA